MTYNDLLIEAVFENNVQRLIDLINKGADVHMKNEYPLILACSKGYLNIVAYIVNMHNPDVNSLNGMALKNACVYGQIKIVKFLIDNGADINCNDGDPLRWSLYKSQHEIIKYLVEKGADLNNPVFMEICSKKKDKEMYDYLMKNGAKCNFINLI